MSGLQFNVVGLLKEPTGAARDYEVIAGLGELDGLVEEVQPAGELLGQLRLMRTPRSVFALGHLETRLAMECSRCLADTEVPIDFDVEAEFFPEVDVSTGQALPLPDDDLAFTIDANHELDLREVVRQHVLLELPMRSLCTNGCQGLCPECGANLNEGLCACKPDTLDERLMPLRSLLERRSGVG